MKHSIESIGNRDNGRERMNATKIVICLYVICDSESLERKRWAQIVERERESVSI